MDDDTARKSCKVDLTAREDDYLVKRFTKLSQSGHDLTPMSIAELGNEKNELKASNTFDALKPNKSYLGFGKKGVYAWLNIHLYKVVLDYFIFQNLPV